MAEQTSDEEQLLHRLFEQISQHVETRVEYFTLTTAEKTSGIVADLVGAITVFVFSVIVLFFFSMGFGWWLGNLIDNRAGGFALAGLVFVPIGFLFYHWIRPFARRKVIQSIMNKIEPENTTEHE